MNSERLEINADKLGENGEKYWVRVLEIGPISDEISYLCYQNMEK